MFRNILTKADATQLADGFKTAVDSLAQMPTDKLFVEAKPPFKCAACKTKFKLKSGFKCMKEKLCVKCFVARLQRGYAKIAQAEALTGQKIGGDDLRETIRQIEEMTGSVSPPTDNN